MPGNRTWSPGALERRRRLLEERAGDFTTPRGSSALWRRKSWLPGRGDEYMPWHCVHIFRSFAVLVMTHYAIRCRWIKTEQIENSSRDSLGSAQCHRGKKRVVVLNCQLLGDLEVPGPVCKSTSKSCLKEVGIVTLITGSVILRAKEGHRLNERETQGSTRVYLSLLPSWGYSVTSCLKLLPS